MPYPYPNPPCFARRGPENGQARDLIGRATSRASSAPSRTPATTTETTPCIGQRAASPKMPTSTPAPPPDSLKPQRSRPGFRQRKPQRRSRAPSVTEPPMADETNDDREEWLRKTRERLEREEAEKKRPKAAANGLDGKPELPREE